MAKKCARTFSIVVEKGKKSILDVSHLLPVAIARYVAATTRAAQSSPRSTASIDLDLPSVQGRGKWQMAQPEVMSRRPVALKKAKTKLGRALWPSTRARATARAERTHPVSLCRRCG